MKMEPTLRSPQVLKQEEEDLGYEGKEILGYVKEQKNWIEKRGQLGETSGWQNYKQMIKREQTNYRQKDKRGQMRVTSRSRLLRLRLQKNKPR